LQNHPDWPSLLCISDSLNKWHIPNAAAKSESRDLDEIPVPFIAYTNDRETPIAVVVNTNTNKVELFQKNYNKCKIVDRETFLKTWTGIYLIAEPNEDSGEPGYKSNRIKEKIKLALPVLSGLTLVLLSFFMLYNKTNLLVAESVLSVAGIYIQYFILLTGIIVTSLLLWYEIDKNNPVLQKVCTGIAKGNCNAILTGNQSKLFNWLSWSEVGFIYFTGSLFVVLSSIEASAELTLLAWLNILALPYTIFSVYYQWRIAKQWCLLCLAVQALLLLGAINVIINGYLQKPFAINAAIITMLIIAYALPLLLWYTLKPFILKQQEAVNTKREYLRIKFNTEIFETLLNRQKKITIPVDGLGIDLGNPDATNTLIKVCNPYCGPCAKAHPEIEKLLEENENLKVKIIFLAINSENHPTFWPACHLLSIKETGNNELMKKALNEWYLPEKKDYEIFFKKFPTNGEVKKQSSNIDMMSNWCIEMNIQFTPTFFINGNQLPNAYSIGDLKYFLLE
jgi:thiol-disulfide isomerase/thioredoxin